MPRRRVVLSPSHDQLIVVETKGANAAEVRSKPDVVPRSPDKPRRGGGWQRRPEPRRTAREEQGDGAGHGPAGVPRATVVCDAFTLSPCTALGSQARSKAPLAPRPLSLVGHLPRASDVRIRRPPDSVGAHFLRAASASRRAATRRATSSSSLAHRRTSDVRGSGMVGAQGRIEAMRGTRLLLAQ